jgi:hypothetical protein
MTYEQALKKSRQVVPAHCKRLALRVLTKARTDVGTVKRTGLDRGNDHIF